MVKIIENKLKVLVKIASKFNEKEITWAVGASALLFFKNKVDSFNDIDILVVESDINKVIEIMSKIGEIKPKNSNITYKTKYYIDCIVDEVDVTIIAGMIIDNDGKEYYLPLKEDEIIDEIILEGEIIPLHSLTLWKKYYQFMGNEKRVNEI